MDGIDRIYDLHTTLRNRRGPISTRELMHRLECSRPTLQRTLTHLRDFFGAPIRNKKGEGYYYDESEGDVFSLPGLWFNAAELHALLAMQQLLAELDPGILSEHLEPFRERIDELLGKASPETRHFPAEKIRLLALHYRRPDAAIFRETASALIRAQRLRLSYAGRARDRLTHRSVSPQRLVHYRDNWYLDGWCHDSRAIRTFALDRIRELALLEQPAKQLPKRALDEHLAAGYGIFAGPARHKALLRFTPERARWVADERWHPAQRGQFTTDGSYELELPYSDARELIGDILRHGAGVEVIRPRGLREDVKRELAAAHARYREPC